MHAIALWTALYLFFSPFLSPLLPLSLQHSFSRLFSASRCDLIPDIAHTARSALLPPPPPPFVLVNTADAARAHRARINVLV